MSIAVGVLAAAAVTSSLIQHPDFGHIRGVLPLVVWLIGIIVIVVVTVARVARRDWDYLAMLLIAGGVLALIGGVCAPTWFHGLG